MTDTAHKQPIAKFFAKNLKDFAARLGLSPKEAGMLISLLLHDDDEPEARAANYQKIRQNKNGDIQRPFLVLMNSKYLPFWSPEDYKLDWEAIISKAPIKVKPITDYQVAFE